MVVNGLVTENTKKASSVLMGSLVFHDFRPDPMVKNSLPDKPSVQEVSWSVSRTHTGLVKHSQYYAEDVARFRVSSVLDDGWEVWPLRLCVATHECFRPFTSAVAKWGTNAMLQQDLITMHVSVWDTRIPGRWPSLPRLR